MAITDNLVAFWELEEASGTRADALGVSTLTSNNAVGSTTGKVGQAATFVAASSQSLSHADSATLSMPAGTSFTIQTWVNLTDVSGTYIVIAKGNVSAPMEYGLYFDATPHLNFRVADGTHLDTVTWSGTPTSATWYHIIAWYDNGGASIGLAVNAGSADTGSSTGSHDTTETFFLGDDGASRFMNGTIDQVGIWTRVLTSGERTTLYNGGAGLSYAAMTGGVSHAALPLLGVG
jgi:hypothetical protein